MQQPHQPRGLQRIADLRHFMGDGLWQIDRSQLPRAHRLAVDLLRVGYVLFKELTNGLLTLRAMSLVYTTLLSIVPLLAVSFSVLKAFGVHNQVEPILSRFVEPMGPQGVEVVTRLLTFVENMKVGVLGAVGLGLLLYTVISLLQKIEMAFNDVWRTKTRRSLSRRFSDYLSVVMVGPVLVFSALGVSATAMNSSFALTLLSFEPFGTLMVMAAKLVPILFVVAAFTFIYIFIPNTKVKLSSALVGALVGGIMWESVGMLFATFAAGSVKYAAIYSGLAIMIMFMIWLYLSWLILLFGAHVAYLYQHPEQVRKHRAKAQLSSRHHERIGLLLMVLVAKRFCRGECAWSSEELARRLSLPTDTIEEQIDLLVQTGLLVETADTPVHFVPARDPATISLTSLFQILRSAGETSYTLHENALLIDEVEATLRVMEEAVNTALMGRSLRDLACAAG